MNVHVSRKELEKLKKIGEGTEGIVYKAGNGILYKVYKSKFYTTLDSEQTKKVYSPRLIEEAVKRQKYVENSTLPLAPLYIDDKFGGCVLKHHRGYVDFHNINILPQKVKLKIFKQLIANVKELTDYYIYHLDLNNKRIDNEHHSNILISFLGEQQIIDLDGKSTAYTNVFDPEYYQMTIQSLFSLIAEILFDIDLTIDYSQEEIEFITQNLQNIGFPFDMAYKIASQKDTSFEEITEVINYAEKSK